MKGLFLLLFATITISASAQKYVFAEKFNIINGIRLPRLDKMHNFDTNYVVKKMIKLMGDKWYVQRHNPSNTPIIVFKEAGLQLEMYNHCRKIKNETAPTIIFLFRDKFQVWTEQKVTICDKELSSNTTFDDIYGDKVWHEYIDQRFSEDAESKRALYIVLCGHYVLMLFDKQDKNHKLVSISIDF